MRVLFVSKPIAPPFHDGTKCLVRDVAGNLTRWRPTVMTARGAPPVRGARSVAVYAAAGGFTPGLAQNARAAAWLVAGSRADVWHFVFAPNPATSAVGRGARAIRRRPVVQTVASAPRTFARVERLLFGDVVVAQSRHTRDRILEECSRAGVVAPRVEVILPPVPTPIRRDAAARTRARRSLAIDDGAPVFVYPGDLETSTGAETVARAVEPIARAVPGAIVVFACRAKTERAPEIERDLASRLDPAHVRFAGEIGDLLALVAGATAVLFPVDDLWGKVDLPIALLEAMELGAPVIALDHGPLADLQGAVLVPRGSDDALVGAAVALARDAEHRERIVAAQRAAIAERHAARVVAARYEALYDDVAAGRLGG